MTRSGSLCVLLLLGAPAAAQETLMEVCTAASDTPAAFDACAIEAYETADADLNEVYRLAIVRAKAFDGAAAVAESGGEVTLESALRQSQDDWTAFRDSDCAAIVLTLDDAGGTDDAASGALCRAEKSLMRAQSLRAMLSDY